MVSFVFGPMLIYAVLGFFGFLWVSLDFFTSLGLGLGLGGLGLGLGLDNKDFWLDRVK